MAPLERGYLLTRIYRFVKVLFVIGILLVFGVSLCACSVPQIIEVPENLPDYMKDVYKDIAKQGIKVVYEPEVMEPIPKPTKAYGSSTGIRRLQRAVISLTRRFTNYTEKRVAIQEQHRIY